MSGLTAQEELQIRQIAGEQLVDLLAEHPELKPVDTADLLVIFMAGIRAGAAATASVLQGQLAA